MEIEVFDRITRQKDSLRWRQRLLVRPGYTSSFKFNPFWDSDEVPFRFGCLGWRRRSQSRCFSGKYLIPTWSSSKQQVVAAIHPMVTNLQSTTSRNCGIAAIINALKGGEQVNPRVPELRMERCNIYITPEQDVASYHPTAPLHIVTYVWLVSGTERSQTIGGNDVVGWKVQERLDRRWKNLARDDWRADDLTVRGRWLVVRWMWKTNIFIC